MGREHQILVDLVRDQDQVVLLGEAGDGGDLVPGPDPAARIVGRAEDDHADAAPGDRGAGGVEVDPVQPVLDRHRRLDHPALVRADHAGEGVVDRGEQQDAVAGGGEGVERDRDGRDDARRRKDPVGLDRPAVARRHPARDRAPPRPVVAHVAEDAVVDVVAKRLQHAVRRAEIAVGDPHRQAVVGIDVIDLAHHVPLRGQRAATVHQPVEIHSVPRLPILPARPRT